MKSKVVCGKITEIQYLPLALQSNLIKIFTFQIFFSERDFSIDPTPGIPVFRTETWYWKQRMNTCR